MVAIFSTRVQQHVVEGVVAAMHGVDSLHGPTARVDDYIHVVCTCFPPWHEDSYFASRRQIEAPRVLACGSFCGVDDNPYIVALRLHLNSSLERLDVWIDVAQARLKRGEKFSVQVGVGSQAIRRLVRRVSKINLRKLWRGIGDTICPSR